MINTMQILAVNPDGLDALLPIIDYGQLLSVDGGEFVVRLPEDLTPRSYPDGRVGYDFYRLRPEVLGLRVLPSELRNRWIALKDNGMRLDDVATNLIASDITLSLTPVQGTRCLVRFFPSITKLFAFVGLVDEVQRQSTEMCMGLESRIVEMRRRLNSRAVELGRIYRRSIDQPSVYLKQSWHLLEGLIASVAELEVLRALLDLGHACIMPKSGSDIVVPKLGNLRLEVKARTLLQDDNRGGEPAWTPQKPLTASLQAHVALLAWASTAKLRYAVDQQHPDIFVCDLTHTALASVLPPLAEWTSAISELPKAIDAAIALAKRATPTVIAFASAVSLHHRTYAMVLPLDVAVELSMVVRRVRGGQRIDTWELARRMHAVLSAPS